jgi:hypothetical protein
MPPIIKNIPTMNDNNILALYKNAIRLLEKGSNSDAEKVIAAIQNEWHIRLLKAKKGNYKASTPNIGMLKTLGYAVGQEGVKTKIRQIILGHVMAGQLPVVGSPAYTLEWGTPSSNKRYYKLYRTLQSFVSGAIARSDREMEKAIIEWSEDLEFIKIEYG